MEAGMWECHHLHNDDNDDDSDDDNDDNDDDNNDDDNDDECESATTCSWRPPGDAACPGSPGQWSPSITEH